MRGHARTRRLPAGVKSGAEFYFCIQGERVSTAQETRKRPWECGDGGIELRAKRPRAAAPAVAIPTAAAPAAIVLTTAVTPTTAAPAAPSLSLPRATPVPLAEPPTLAPAIRANPAQAVAAESATVVGGVTFESEARILSKLASVALATLPPYTLTLIGKAAYVRSQLGLGEGMTLPQQDSDPSIHPSPHPPIHLLSIVLIHLSMHRLPICPHTHTHTHTHICCCRHPLRRRCWAPTSATRRWSSSLMNF